MPVAAALRVWLAERRGRADDHPIFHDAEGEKHSAATRWNRRLATYVARAIRTCASLSEKRITLHVLRHTAAMRLLHAGVDTSVIALWLGHEQVEPRRSTCMPNLAQRARPVGRDTPLHTRPGALPSLSDALLAFLEAL